MVYASKTTQKIKYDVDNQEKVKVDFGIESEIVVAHPIFKNGKFGTSKRTFLAQMSLDQRRQGQLATSEVIEVKENTLVVMFNADQQSSL